jgi:hypothetical protein
MFTTPPRVENLAQEVTSMSERQYAAGHTQPLRFSDNSEND